MIKEPPLITMRRGFPRPRAREVAAFAGAPTGNVVDALGGRGALDYTIKSLAPVTSVLVGVALTCRAGPADNLALFAALDAAKPGDILVAASDAFSTTAITGDLLLGMARNRGIRGLVTDGLVRDLVGILAVGLPVFCRGLTPNSPDRNGPASVGLPVVVGGVQVESGDVVVADADGVVIVPRSKLAIVLKALERGEGGGSGAGGQGEGRAGDTRFGSGHPRFRPGCGNFVMGGRARPSVGNYFCASRFESVSRSKRPFRSVASVHAPDRSPSLRFRSFDRAAALGRQSPRPRRHSAASLSAARHDTAWIVSVGLIPGNGRKHRTAHQ